MVEREGHDDRNSTKAVTGEVMIMAYRRDWSKKPQWNLAWILPSFCE
jgi:hypothetical protein